MTRPKEDGFSVTHSEPVRQPLACQKCGGEIQGWTCQGCGQVFRENDAGALVFAPMEAVAWRWRVDGVGPWIAHHGSDKPSFSMYQPGEVYDLQALAVIPTPEGGRTG
jgi:hypothetical protein